MSTFAISESPTPQFRKAEATLSHAGMSLRKEVALGSLALSIVHDLRNPLAAIHLGAEMLKGSQLTEEQVRRVARNIYTASAHIQELLPDYDDLRRTMDTQPRPSDLRSLVAYAVDRIAAVAEAQSVVVVQNIPANIAVIVDRGRIRSVLANLFANALEAMPTGGSIGISAIAAEDSVVIRVRDSGPGIAPEIRDRLFQPFVTARKQNGWGLGLAQARLAVIDQGGEMWLESASGRGTCFAFTLPTSMANCPLRVEDLGNS